MTKTEYLELIKTINYHMDLYYNQDTTEISDYEYDQLMQKLKEAEKEHPEWKSVDSPTEKVGGIVQKTNGEKIQHSVPMLSIQDVFSTEDVVAWMKKVFNTVSNMTFSVEEKIDGLSVTIRYKKNKDGNYRLVLGETRGDGYIGEDVTKNILEIQDIPHVISIKNWPDPRIFENINDFEVRGEVYMTKKNFDDFNQMQKIKGEALAANPRNLAAGTLRQLNPLITKERKLSFFAFNIQKGFNLDHSDGLAILKKMGIPVVPHKTCESIEDVLKEIESISQRRNRLAYNIDGAVIKLDDIFMRSMFPAGNKYAGGHIAYKYPPENAIIVIDDIDVAVGRTGKLTYTAVFHDKNTGNPANLCGTQVSRATVHNMDYIQNMKIGIGGEYELIKSGDIIPKIVKCVKPPKSIYVVPTTCPICHSNLKKNGSADLVCINKFCSAQLSRSIEYFASQNCMNIVGLGPQLIDALIRNGYISNFIDIYHLKNKKDDLVNEGILGREKNTEKILQEIDKSKNNEPYRFLAGLGIDGVGIAIAKDLMNNFKSLQNLMAASYDDIAQINGVGEILANNILSFFKADENRKLILEFIQLGGKTEIQTNTSQLVDLLQGKTFVVTGTMETMSRKEITTMIESAGGKCTGSVSKNTDYIVLGNNPGSKLDKAKKYNVKIISESELIKLVNPTN